MKKLFSAIVAFSFALTGFTATAECASPDASPEAKPAETTVSTPAPAPEAAPIVSSRAKVEVPQLISEHLAVRFPDHEVKGITREGVTYVVDLGDGLHIRYDNCFNPVCYGFHNHE